MTMMIKYHFDYNGVIHAFNVITSKVTIVTRIQNKQGINNPNYKTGLAVKGRRPSVYNSWRNMKARCYQPTHPAYARYGGRGITVCEEWRNIAGFYAWSKESGWQQGLSIDRIDIDGNYCPANCRWVTISENSRRKRTTKLTMHEANVIRQRIDAGEDAHVLAKEHGITYANIWFIKNNYTHVAEGECIKRLNERNKMKAIS